MFACITPLSKHCAVVVSAWLHARRTPGNDRALVITLFGASLLLFCGFARAQVPSVPGIPEPGIVVVGQVFDRATRSPVTISSVSWSVREGESAGGKQIELTGTSRPATSFSVREGVYFYQVTIPFDTRRIGTDQLGDPASQSDVTLRYSSFELKTTPTSYVLTPTINGVPASVIRVNGNSSSGNSTTVAGFSADTRGRVVRVDLEIVQSGLTYEIWAQQFFQSATGRGAPDFDADGDGARNDDEYRSGTDPTDANSVLAILALVQSSNGIQVALTWRSVSGRRYQVERSDSLSGGTWIAVGNQVEASAETTIATIPISDVEAGYFRVRVIAQP